MTRVYQFIFDRARSPLTRVLAATIIGAIIASLAGLRKDNDGNYSVPVLAVAGAGLGFCAAMILMLADRAKNSTLGMVLVSLLVLAVILAVIFGHEMLTLRRLGR